MSYRLRGLSSGQFGRKRAETTRTEPDCTFPAGMGHLRQFQRLYPNGSASSSRGLGLIWVRTRAVGPTTLERSRVQERVRGSALSTSASFATTESLERFVGDAAVTNLGKAER